MIPYKETGLYFIFFIFLLTTSGCKNQRPNFELQVKEGYERYTTLLDAGVNAMITFRIEEDGSLSARIERPSQEELEAFYNEFMERPLCQDLLDSDEVVKCLVDHLLEFGCVKITTCSSCIYVCP